MWEMWDMRKRDGLDLLTQVVLVLLGVYFICLKQQALVHITTLLGLLMTAGGAACIVRAFIRKEQSSLFLSMPVLLAVGGGLLGSRWIAASYHRAKNVEGLLSFPDCIEEQEKKMAGK